MKTLIVTLGNSEIQIDATDLGSFSIENNSLLKHNVLNSLPIYQNRRPGQSQYFIINEARPSGKSILNQIGDYLPVLKFPIANPLIQFIRDENIDKIIWVVTDQTESQHAKGDTVYYAPIVEKYFEQSFSSLIFDTIAVKNDLTNIDLQYKFWHKQLSNLFATEKEEDSYMLFAQGGIDQINHALTLQLLYRFRERVRIYQNAENGHIKHLLFPHQFLHDLNREKIVKHLTDYDFRRALELWPLSDEGSRKTLEELSGRLELLHDSINGLQINNTKYSELNVIQQNRIKLKDLYASFRIDIIQKKYNSSLTKLFTLFENIFKQWVDEWAEIDTKEYRNNKIRFGETNKKWEDFIQSFIGDKGIKFVKQGYSGKLDMSNPNSASYFYIARYYVKNYETTFKDEQFKKLFNILDKFRNKRNDINHELGAASEQDFLNTLNNARSNPEEFYDLLNCFTQQKDLGIFEDTRNNLLNRLNP